VPPAAGRAGDGSRENRRRSAFHDGVMDAHIIVIDDIIIIIYCDNCDVVRTIF